MKHVLPTHQGRAAEGILAQTTVKKGDVIPNNSHFDTTRANMEFVGGRAVDLLCDEGLDVSIEAPFKGNMNINKLERCIEKIGVDKIPFCMITVTNNTGGGQPVSMANVQAVSNVCRHQGGPLGEGRIVDGCITCPWHGWQYRPSDGCSPPPFEEKVETYRVRIADGAVWVHPEPAAPGTPQQGAPVG